MIDTNLLEKFYSKIFTIPKKRITVTLGLITIVFASALNGMVSKSFFAKRYLFIGFAIILLLLLFSRPIGLAFNSRRLFFLALLILIFVEIFDFFVIHLGFFELIVLSPAALSTLLTLVLYFTSRADEKKVGIVSMAILLLLYPVDYHYSFNAPHRMLSYSISTVFGVLLAIIYIKFFIDKNYDKVNMKRMLKAFILFWLTTNPEEFESELKKTGEVRRGFVKCLKFSGSCSTKLVNTAFHPGPIRNVGGGKLVGSILKAGNTMYLHSATKHELNPAGGEDIERIVNSISCCDVSCKPKEPFKLEGKNYTLYDFPFDSVDLLVLSGKTVTDDLPPELNVFAEKAFGKDVLLCEAHNAHRNRYEVSDFDVQDVKELIEEASKISREREKAKLSCFFKKESVETCNICGCIAALMLDYGNRRYCILMVDGNNMVLEFRREIEEIARNRDVELIAVTTDNHTKTGVSPKIGYKPVGSDVEDREAVKSFLIRFMDEFERGERQEAEVTYGRRDVEVTVMGKRFFESIDRGFRELGFKALYLFWFCILLQMVVTGILGTFLIGM